MGANKAPHGGALKDLMLDAAAATEATARARHLPNWDLSVRQACDLELLINGAFSPLEGFLEADDYAACLETLRLANGVLWPIPVTLDVSEPFAASLEIGSEVALRDAEGVLIALLDVASIYSPDKIAEARAVFGSEDPRHPGVRFLLEHTQNVYLGGRVRGIEPPPHYDFLHLRDSPRELRARFEKLGWRRVVALQSRNPLFNVHREVATRAAREHEANLLVHGVVGGSCAQDLEYFARIRCYEAGLRQFPEQTTMLSLFSIAERGAGPREALWQALIHKNYGCTHFLVGHDHGSPRATDGQRQLYPPYAAQELLRAHAEELDITIAASKKLVYVDDCASFLPEDEVEPPMRARDLSSTELARRLREDIEIPEWFATPELIREIANAQPPLYQQGFTVFLTGLSGAGKSTIAQALKLKLLERGERRVTLLDGDIVRKHLSSELGFSKEHRDLNIMRIGFVASEITKHGGVAICAPIAPYAASRDGVRALIEPVGGFLEVYVATPIEVCEARDRKGLYARARAGKIRGFTGVDDPYEEPVKPELRIDTAELSADLAAHRIIVKLEALGFLR